MVCVGNVKECEIIIPIDLDDRNYQEIARKRYSDARKGCGRGIRWIGSLPVPAEGCGRRRKGRTSPNTIPLSRIHMTSCGQLVTIPTPKGYPSFPHPGLTLMDIPVQGGSCIPSGTRDLFPTGKKSCACHMSTSSIPR